MAYSDGYAGGYAGGPSVDAAALLHGDALGNWLLANASLTVTDTEVVGMLNELNGTSGIEYAEARGTYLGIPPAG